MFKILNYLPVKYACFRVSIHFKELAPVPAENIHGIVERCKLYLLRTTLIIIVNLWLTFGGGGFDLERK